MTTVFPASLDNFTNPTGSDDLDSVAVIHSDQHANTNDAIEALQAKVGIDGSAVPTSLDKRVADLEAAPGGSVSWGGINGDLEDQTDLQAVLDDKLESSVAASTYVAQTVTVNGHALSSNVTVTKGDVGLGNVVNADTTTTANITDSTNKRFVTDAQLTVIGNTSGTNTGDQTSVSGNAGTATALQNARMIGGVSFDGTANIVPQTIQSVNEATDTTCFPLFITASGSQSLQPCNNSSLTFNSNTATLGATNLLATTSLTIPANTNQIVLGTTNTGTISMAALNASRTWTFPNNTGTVVLLTNSATIGNKTMDNTNTYQSVPLSNTGAVTTSGVISYDGTHIYGGIASAASQLDKQAIIDNTSGTYASLPAASTAGYQYWPNDGFVTLRDTGSAWQEWGPIFPLTPPVLGNFSWINQGSATTTTTNGGIYLSAPALGSGTTANLLVKSAPSTPYTVTLGFLPNVLNKQFSSCGLAFRESGTGELHLLIAGCGILSGSSNFAPSLASQKLNSPTSFSANYQISSYAPGGFHWLRIADNGTNRICSFSSDGINFHAFHTIGRTDFLTADQVGFFVGAENSATPNSPAAMTVLHYKEA